MSQVKFTIALAALLAVFLALGARLGDVPATGAVKTPKSAGAAARLPDFTPLVFEANQGQADGEVCFLARGKGFTVYLTQEEMVLVQAQPRAPAKNRVEALLYSENPEMPVNRRTASEEPLRLRFVGANDVSPRGIQELAGKSNYFIGNRSVLGVRQYARVLYKNLYPGIDLVFYSNHGELEYDFVVAPGATPADIRLEPSNPVEARADGTLSIGSLRKERPVAYQQIGARREGVPAQYAVAAKRISFALGPYDHSLPLVVDPRIVTSRYFGGSKGDHTNDAAVDSSGNIYITGYTSSTDFPLKNAFQKKWAGVVDGFVTKLSPSGNIIYSTYLGGSSDEYPKAIAVDGAGHAYVVGLSGSTDFPVKNPLFSTPQEDLIGVPFVTKLSPSGAALVYSTVLGPDGIASGIAVRNGCAFVVGGTSAPLPAVVNAIQPEPAGRGEGFIMKLNPAGTALLFSSYFGGSGSDGISKVGIDPLGALYVAGGTRSTDFPVTAGAFQTKIASTCHGKNCNVDVFVAKINVETRKIVYSTYIGGKGYDVTNGFAVDRLGNAYVTGLTDSGNFPAVNAVLRRKPGNNAYVAKLNASGSGMVYSTFWGSGVGEDVAVDYYGNAYVTGGNDYCTLPVLNPLPNSPACSPGFVTKLALGGSILYSSYLSLGFGFAVTMGPSNTIYLAGEDFGANNAYVARITRQ
jgi:hypothetical protein